MRIMRKKHEFPSEVDVSLLHEHGLAPGSDRYSTIVLGSGSQTREDPLTGFSGAITDLGMKT